MVQQSVIILAKAYPPNLGGIETYSHQIAKSYALKGFKTYVITQYDVTRGWIVKDNVEILNVGAGKQIFVACKMFYYLYQLLKTVQPLKIHATTWRVALPAIILNQSKKLIITLHGREILMSNGILKKLCSYTLKKANTLIAISPTSFNACTQHIRHIKDKTHIRYNGLSFKDYIIDKNYIEKDNLNILAACRLIERKNIKSLLLAIKNLNDKNIYPIVKIAGDGPQKQDLQNLAKKLAIQVEFLGHISQSKMPELYQWADIFVHPHSHNHNSKDIESFCLSIADAMSFGLPVISGQDGAASDYIQHTINGYLIDGKNIDAIADLILALHNKDTRYKIGKAAQIYALSHFDWQKHIIL